MSSLGKDLETIRKKLNLSLEDVYDVTRIPVHIIKSIEEETLFGGVETNKTYIRSFVRSYAKGLKISEEDIIEALNQMDENRYEGFLAEKYAGVESPESSQEDSTPKEPEETGTSEEHKEKPLPEEKEKLTHGEATPYSQPDPNRYHNQPTPPPPSVSSINWAAIGKKFYQFNVKSRVWVVVVFLILAVAVIGFYFFYTPGEMQRSSTVLDTTAILNNQTANDTQSTLSTGQTLDTALSESTVAPEESDDQEQQQEPEETQISLPDTLRLIVYAAHNKLEPVRVNSDINDRLSPYWIDQGEAMRFEFVDTLRLRGQYDRMELLFNGHLIEDAFPTYYNQNENRVIITRSIFENDEMWQTPVSLDTLAGNIPPPRVIKDRPTF